MVRSAQFLGPLQGDQPTLPAPARRTLRVPAQPRALALASDLRRSLAVHLLDPGRLLAADDPSTSPYTANALLPMSVQLIDLRVEHQDKVFMGCDYNIDETYIKVKGQWRYLYRAVDKHGQTIDFLLTEQRDKEAALRFLKKAIRRNGLPETITIDGSDANEAAIKSYNEEHGTAIIIRQVKYLNNMVEQDHRGVKRVTRPMLGFKSFEAAQDTLVGIELMHMIKKKQMVLEAGDEGLTAAELFYSLAA